MNPYLSFLIGGILGCIIGMILAIILDEWSKNAKRKTNKSNPVSGGMGENTNGLDDFELPPITEEAIDEFLEQREKQNLVTPAGHQRLPIKSATVDEIGKGGKKRHSKKNR